MTEVSTGRWRERVAATMVVALVMSAAVAVAPGSAALEPPSSAVTISGQSLDIAVTSPASPSVRIPAPDSLVVQGTARIGDPQPAPLHAAFVVDVSNSTETGTYDCNGDGVLSAADDYNGAGSAIGRVIDCEIAGVLAINDGLVRRTNTNAYLIAFAQKPANADMQATSGLQLSTAAEADTLPPAPGDVETVARSLRTNSGSGSIGQYTSITGLGSSTRYLDVIALLADTLSAQPAGEERVAFFLSDGTPTDDFTVGDPTETAGLVAAGIRVNTFAVGALAGGCAPTAPLGFLAGSTGGICTDVVDPGALGALIAEAATIAAVEYSLDGQPFAPVTSHDAVTGAFSVDVPVTLGAHSLRVRVRASDGTLAQDALEIVGIDAPDVADATFAAAEGEALSIPGSVTDDDNALSELAFQWTPVDGNLSTPTAADTVFQSADDGVFTYTLTATDPDGLVGTGQKVVTVSNVAPTVSDLAGPAVVNEGEAAQFTVSFADPGSADAHTVVFDWGDGSAPTTVPVDERSTTHTVLESHTFAPGTPDGVLLRVTVTDDDGGVGIRELAVNINHGPTAALNQDAYTVVEGGSVVVSAAFDDVDGDQLTADLSVGATTVDSATLPGAGTLSTTIGPALTADDAALTVAASVQDAFGLVHGDSASVHVLNARPVIGSVSVPSQVLPEESVTVQGTFSDVGLLDTHSLVIDWGDGGPAPAGSVSGGGDSGTFSATHSYARYGTYYGSLSLCDDDGGCATEQFTIVAGTPPTADAGPDLTVQEGTSATLTGTAIDADTSDGQELTYTWTGDGLLLGASTPTATFHALDQGTHVFTLEVCDSQGVCATDTVEVTVLNVAPTLEALSATLNPMTQAVDLHVSWSDPGNADTFAISVDWKDGTSSAVTPGPGERSDVVSHTYATSGPRDIDVGVSDEAGGLATGTVFIDVALNQAPVVDAGGDYLVLEGSTATLSGSVVDPDGDSEFGSVAFGWAPVETFAGDTATLSPVFDATTKDGSAAGTPHEVRLWADDGLGNGQAEATATVTVLNVAPLISAVAGPTGPVPVGSTTSVEVSFFDPGPTDVHSVQFDWEDGTSETVWVTDGSGFARAEHTSTTAGVGRVNVTVTDSDGSSAADYFEYVVSYDPTAGFVTGAGSIESPAGAYPDNPLATGSARFGLLSKYQKGATVPTGDTEFQFKGVGLTFASTAYEYLVISGTKATYRGVGTVNGESGYSFLVTVIDGTKSDPDRFRIQIWDGNRGNAVVYDNELQALPDGGDPTTVIATGSIVIHKG